MKGERENSSNSKSSKVFNKVISPMGAETSRNKYGVLSVTDDRRAGEEDIELVTQYGETSTRGLQSDHDRTRATNMASRSESPCSEKANDPYYDEEKATRNLILVVIISSIGNVLEWFDFAIFGYFADVFSDVFFPGGDALQSLAKTFAVFAGAFLMRPIGGILFGYIGDNFGRKRAVLLSIFLMAFSSFATGCLPTYNQVGIAAPLMLVVTRCLQGVSVGGQLVGSFVFTVETAPPRHRTLVGAVCLATSNLGTAIGSAVAALLHAVLTETELHTWGWRLPFWTGVIAAVAGYYLESYVHEVPFVQEFQHQQEQHLQQQQRDYYHHQRDKHDKLHSGSTTSGVAPSSSSLATVAALAAARGAGAGAGELTRETERRGSEGTLPMLESAERSETQHLGQRDDNADAAASPLQEALAKHKLKILLIACVSSMWPTMFYIDMVWTANMQETLISPPLKSAFAINSVALLLSILFIPLAGAFTDRIGTVRALQMATLIGVITSPFAFMLLDGTAAGMACCQLVLLPSLALFGATYPTWMVLASPQSCRYSVVGIAFNLAQAVLGGPTPLIATGVYGAGGAEGVGCYRAAMAFAVFCVLVFNYGFQLCTSE